MKVPTTTPYYRGVVSEKIDGYLNAISLHCSARLGYGNNMLSWHYTLHDLLVFSIFKHDATL
jgi:hypothetical protein